MRALHTYLDASIAHTLAFAALLAQKLDAYLEAILPASRQHAERLALVLRAALAQTLAFGAQAAAVGRERAAAMRRASSAGWAKLISTSVSLAASISAWISHTLIWLAESSAYFLSVLVLVLSEDVPHTLVQGARRVGAAVRSGRSSLQGLVDSTRGVERSEMRPDGDEQGHGPGEELPPAHPV